ncbi:MAG: GntR family transcriptional regulator [Caryophanon sp.]|nr:GntR family transcriptional regulator [Caryophanon sp.]
MTRLYDDIYTLLEERFLRGDYLPDDVISDYALSKELQTSRNPIRRAMERLQQQGFLSNNAHQSKLVIGYSEDECAQMYTYVLHLVELAIATDHVDVNSLLRETAKLKQLSDRSTYFDYVQQLASIYRLIISYSNNIVYTRSFDQWHKPFIRMIMLRFRLGQVSQPFKEVQQFTQLCALLHQQQLQQAKIYVQCIASEWCKVPSPLS